MNQQEASAKIEDAKKLINETAPFIKANSNQLNAAVLFTATTLPDGQTQFIGTILGNGKAIIDTLVEAMENDPAAAELICDAVNYFLHRKTCNCENCIQRRQAAALRNMLNNNQN